MGAIQEFHATLITVNKPGAFDPLNGAAAPSPDKKASVGKGATAQAPRAVAAASVPAPAPDAGKTWGSPQSKRDLNFGHHPVNGELFQYHASGQLTWGDNGKALTADQWANMPAFQQAKLRAMVQAHNPGALAAFDRAMSKGTAAKAQTQPKGIDNSLVSPFSSELAQHNQLAMSPAAVAERVRQAREAS